MNNQNQKILLFGATGNIGSAIYKKFTSQGWEVVSVTRKENGLPNQIVWDPSNTNEKNFIEDLKKFKKFHACCWAQGTNFNDSINDFNESHHNDMYQVNVVYIIKSLHYILKNGLLQNPAKLCILSSIWQDISRQDKLSYSVSKSALRGLVLSLTNDLGKNGHLVNAVLPGALETNMTLSTLTEKQINNIKSSTSFNRLPDIDSVVNIVYFLLSEENKSITGQFIKVDLGYSDVKNI